MSDNKNNNIPGPCVLIIGCGSVGALIAQGLKKRGISYRLFEKYTSEEAQTRDWNFGIYWAQDALKACLPDELFSQMRSAQIDSHISTANDILPLYQAATGELLKKIPVPFNMRLRRQKFIRLITQGLDIEYAKALVDVDTDGPKVTAKFADGTEAVGDLLIGCDGAHSKVRNFLFGENEGEAQITPLDGYHTVTRLPREAALKLQSLHPRYSCAIHPNGMFTWQGFHNHDSENPEDWEFLLSETFYRHEGSLSSLENNKILFKEKAGSFAEPLRSIYQSIPEDAVVWGTSLTQWPTKPWDNRKAKVTLAGDAAHPMTFHRGQGLNNAILDGAQFLSAWDKASNGTTNSVSDVLSIYEKEIWERGRDAVNMSYRNSLEIHNFIAPSEGQILFKYGLGVSELPTFA